MLPLAICLLGAGCSTWKPWGTAVTAEPERRPDLAESDETLRQPLRPKSEQKRSKWDLSNFLDPRTQSIESNLGI
jgi:hypothetical protein